MDYEKEYKKKLEDAKYWHDCSEGDIPAILEEIFSELKENGDKRIREAISYAIANSTHEDGILINGVTESEAIAWLEKQGEQKSKKEVDNLHNYLYGEQKPADKIEPKFNVGDRIVDNCGYTWKIGGILNQFYILEGVEGGESRPTIEWVDKTCHLWTTQDAEDGDVLVDEDNNIGLYRGEKDDSWESYIYLGCNNYLYGPNIGGYHEHKNTKPATKEQRDLLFKKMKEAGYKWDTEKKELNEIEQKTVDKVEPKFKVGDWIVDNITKDVFLIKSVNSGYCSLEDTKGNIYSPCLPFESDFHLWTIQDAKDGDVLEFDCGIGIFKNLSDDGYNAHCYCYYDRNGQLETNDYSLYDIYEATPATKEQRDLLFTKMKEAGYEWDDEKKELKKIHNALEECKIENIEHGKYYYCIKDYFAGGKKQASKGDVVQALRGLPIMGLGVKANEYFLPVNSIKQKTDWGEEDEEMFDAIIADIQFTQKVHNNEINQIVFEREIDWLKSLKERVQPQPQKKWREEDEWYLKSVISRIKEFGDSSVFGLINNDIQWLKTIKQRLKGE